MLLVRSPAGCESERLYILDVLLKDFLGLDFRHESGASADVIIETPDGGSVVIRDQFFRQAGGDWLSSRTLPAPRAHDISKEQLVPFDARLSHGTLPVPYGRKDGDSWVKVSGRQVELGMDLLGSAFFLLSRYEELVSGERDVHDRYPAARSWQASGGWLERALVDEYVEILWDALHHACPSLSRSRRTYRFFLSHDLDFPYAAAPWRGPWALARSLGADLLLRRSPAIACRRVVAFLGPGASLVRFDPYETFDRLMDASERAGIKGAFNVIPEGRHALDGFYPLQSRKIRSLLGRILKRGHEVGVHPGYGTYQDANLMGGQVEKLRSALKNIDPDARLRGGRQHFLQWKAPITWRLWERLGLSYDSSLGYAEAAGFRAGCCREFRVYDAEERRPLNLRERPLIVMDGTLLDPGYMALSESEALGVVERLVAVCRRHDGDFTLLWHNNNLLNATASRVFDEACRIAS